MKGVAMITGAGRGIGRAVAEHLSFQSGMCVALLDQDEAAVVAVAAAIRNQGGSAIGLAGDVADEGALQKLVDTASGKWKRLDCLINNAAISLSDGIETFDSARFRQVMAVNLEGAMLASACAKPWLARSGMAAIVNIASIQGLRGTVGSLSYAASKASLLSVTRSLACELAPLRIRVNAVAPGFVDTDMAQLPDGRSEYETEWFRSVYLTHGRLPLQRPARPEEIAGPVAFLCSQAASYMTGTVLMVDGGLTATF